MDNTITGKVGGMAGVFLVLTSLMLFSCSDDPVSPPQYGAVKGRVTDVYDDSPIEGVSITTTPATVSVTTDIDGTYKIDTVEPDSYVLRAVKQGYKNSIVYILVQNGKVTTADITMAIEPSTNHPPDQPFNPFPANGASGQERSLVLSWSASDPDESDSLFCDIRFGSSASSPLPSVVSDHEDTTWVVDDLLYETTYFWQVVVKDNSGVSVNGDVWSFTTGEFPDNRLVFASNRDGNYEIYSASVNGENIVRLTDNPARDWWPVFNPDRDLIAFTSTRSISSHIYVMNTDGSSVEKITSVPVAGYNNYGIGFCWSYDGYSLYYSYYDTLYRIDADGSNLTAIAEAPEGMHFRECTASPLGDKLVVVAQGRSVFTNTLYIMNVDGSYMEALVEDLPGTLGHPDFSPDGQAIVYYYDVSEYESAGVRLFDSHIFAINIDGTINADLSTDKTPGTNDLDPVWSPDGARIIFVNVPNDDSSPPDIYIMDYTIMEGYDRKRQLIIPDGEMPDWR